MALPKVLIVGQPFNSNTGGGITLSNLFNGWDRDRIAVACSGYLLLDNIDTEVCNTYYQLGYKEHKWRFPFNYLQRKYSSGLIEFDSNRFQDLTISKSKFRVKLIMNLFYPLLDYFGLTNFIKKTKLSEEFCSWLKGYDPEVVYVQTSSRDAILFCLLLEAFLKKPFIFHMMDDWPSTINEKGLFKNYWQKKIDLDLRRLLDKCSVLMSISDEMTREYKIRYKKDFITFHNPIDIEFWKKYQRTSYELNESPVVLYAGRIGLGIDTSLELIAKAIQMISKDLKISVKFTLQTKEKPAWINKYQNVEYKGFSSYSDLPKIFSESDFLLLPYDFSSESIKYIKFSMPTKAPEYMISGTPIIIFAPEETAIVKYANEYNLAKVITENNISEVYTGIRQLIEDKDLRQEIAQNAKEIAEKNHNSTDVTNRFRKVILSAINKY